MTPLGHISVSFISGSCFIRNSFRDTALPALIIGGILPDMDFLFILFDWFNKVHRVISHNLLFILLVALTGFIIAKSGNKKIVALGLFTGGLLHLAIDSCLDNNPTNGIGTAFFWPFSDILFSPFNLLKANESGIGWDQPLKMVRLMIPLILYEVPLYFLAAFLFFRRAQNRQTSRMDTS
jgi:membrane-bound metal-dependent hydrolase YbcI (DUF457 family)